MTLEDETWSPNSQITSTITKYPTIILTHSDHNEKQYELYTKILEHNHH